MLKVFIIIPAYNEGKHLAKVLRSIKKDGWENIIVVDDGSKDNTFQIAKQEGVIVTRHIVNRGAGAATQTGLAIARLYHADYAIMIDADGQHSSADLKKMLHTAEEKKVDVVIGSRFLGNNKIPILRRIFNRIANLVTWAMAGLYVSDSQSGMKILSRHAMHKIHISSNGFEFCSEIIRQIGWYKLSYVEVPIAVSYSQDSMAKGQNFSTGVSTFFKLVIRSLMR